LKLVKSKYHENLDPGQKRNKTIQVVSFLIMVLAIIVVVVWIVDTQGRLSIFWRFLVVKFNTAICLLLLSCALLLSQYPVLKYRRALLIVFPLVASLIAALSLSEYVFNINIGIDQFFVREVTLNKLYPGRMSISTAIDLLFLGLGLLFLQLSSGRRWKVAAQSSFHLVTILSAIALITDIYNASLYHTIFYVNSMDLHTSVIFLLLSMSASLLNPSLGLLKLFMGRQIGYQVAQRLFVLITLLVLVYGSARLQVERSHTLPIALTVSVMIVCFLLAMLAVVWYVARWMNRADDQRTKAEEKVKAINADLERRVEERSLEIQKKEARYRILIEQASDAIYVVDLKGYFMDVNNKICQITGYSREELLRMNVKEIIDAEELENGQPFSMPTGNDPIMKERTLKRKDGTTFMAEINVKRFEDDTVLVIARDITDRKGVENELRSSEQKYRLLFDSNPVPLWMISRDDLNIIDVNNAAAELYGYSIEEMRGMTARQFRPERDWATQTVDYQLRLQDSAIDFGVRNHLKKDGTLISVHIVAHDIVYNGKDVRLAMTQDVTEKERAAVQLKELYESLQKQAKELEISNSDLEHFAYVASHDLQEPLRMITSFLARLETRYGNILDKNGKQYIHFATDGAKRMRQLILDLLEYSRVGRTAVKIETVDLNNLIKDILKLYQIKIRELDAIVSCELLPTVITYKTPLMQVFQNLISNGLKYQKSGAKPVIDIVCKEKDSAYEFSVRDNGIGISSEFYDKIFIVFQRLHNKGEYSGTGMGLAITKKIVENMGGRIWVESADGMGSTFYFTIPKNL